MKDIVLNDSKEMQARAKELCAELVLVSEPKQFKSGGLLIKASKPGELNSVRKLARKAAFVIADSTDEKTVRFLIEQKWIKFFTNIETSTGRDHTHYRRSNFNQVLAALARETGKTYLVDFSRLLKIDGKKRSLLIGRIMQNIRICQKFKVPVSIATFAQTAWELRNPNDLQALLRALKTKKVEDVEKLLGKLN